MIETTTRGHNGKNADRVEVIWFNRPYQKALGTGRVPIRLSAESYKRHEEAHLFRHHKTKAATSSPVAAFLAQPMKARRSKTFSLALIACILQRLVGRSKKRTTASQLR